MIYAEKKCHCERISSISISYDPSADIMLITHSDTTEMFCSRRIFIFDKLQLQKCLFVSHFAPPPYSHFREFSSLNQDIWSHTLLFKLLHYYAVIFHWFHNPNSIMDTVYPSTSNQEINIDQIPPSLQQHVFQLPTFTCFFTRSAFHMLHFLFTY